jgi:uncharacterized membrane protein
MNPSLILSIALIGFAAGLRGLTPLAVVAWSAYLGCINLASTPFSFMSSPIFVAGLSFLAIGEYVWDLLPNTPNRTASPGLISRILTGSFTAACLLAATNNNFAFCILGGVAAIVGAFGGLQIRMRLGRSLGVNDAWIAIPEDVIAIVMSISAICLVGTTRSA